LLFLTNFDKTFFKSFFFVLPLLFLKATMSFNFFVSDLGKLDDESTYGIIISTKFEEVDFPSMMPFLESHSKEGKEGKIGEKQTRIISSSFKFPGKHRRQVVETMEKLGYKFDKNLGKKDDEKLPKEKDEEKEEKIEKLFSLSKPFSLAGQTKSWITVDTVSSTYDYDHDPFSEWAEFGVLSEDFDVTGFDFPAEKLDKVLKMMKAHGYKQT
jgi:hypothetical protein